MKTIKQMIKIFAGIWIFMLINPLVFYLVRMGCEFIEVTGHQDIMAISGVFLFVLAFIVAKAFMGNLICKILVSISVLLRMLSNISNVILRIIHDIEIPNLHYFTNSFIIVSGAVSIWYLLIRKKSIKDELDEAA